jgi:hypothetical protein
MLTGIGLREENKFPRESDQVGVGNVSVILNDNFGFGLTGSAK